MISIGHYNILKIERETSVGLFLSDPEGEEEVLLPNKYMPTEFEIGDSIEVFVYLDYEERKIATNLTPYIKAGEFGYLQVAAVSEIGAFMDWGMEKQLLVPFGEQRERMEKDKWYVVYCEVDPKTGRLYASSRLGRFINREMPELKPGEQVKLLVTERTELGFSVIINNSYRGMIYHNEIFKPIAVGEQTTGFVKGIREDGKVDVSLQPVGFKNVSDNNAQSILDKLKEENGFLPYSDRSSPEEIYREFAMSKKAFKAAIGHLYKAKTIHFVEGGIRLLHKTQQ